MLAPYLVEGEPAGTVGVLGPTRMDYRKAPGRGRDGVAAARPAALVMSWSPERSS